MTEQTTGHNTPHEEGDGTGTRPHRAGLFDIRVIIGALIGIYGVVLTLMGLFGSSGLKHKADGINVNLWAGLVMIVVAVFFIAWARIRPIVVPEEHQEAVDEDRPAGTG